MPSRIPPIVLYKGQAVLCVSTLITGGNSALFLKPLQRVTCLETNMTFKPGCMVQLWVIQSTPTVLRTESLLTVDSLIYACYIIPNLTPIWGTGFLNCKWEQIFDVSFQQTRPYAMKIHLGGKLHQLIKIHHNYTYALRLFFLHSNSKGIIMHTITFTHTHKQMNKY